MDAGASEKKQKVCEDVNKSAREDICCEAGLCLEHRWHRRYFEKFITSVQRCNRPAWRISSRGCMWGRACVGSWEGGATRGRRGTGTFFTNSAKFIRFTNIGPLRPKSKTRHRHDSIELHLLGCF